MSGIILATVSSCVRPAILLFCSRCRRCRALLPCALSLVPLNTKPRAVATHQRRPTDSPRRARKAIVAQICESGAPGVRLCVCPRARPSFASSASRIAALTAATHRLPTSRPFKTVAHLARWTAEAGRRRNALSEASGPHLPASLHLQIEARRLLAYRKTGLALPHPLRASIGSVITQTVE